MDEARRERLKESLLILEGLSTSQQRTWISERLADDPELAREVARLLDSRPGDALTPLIVPPESLSFSALLPKQIGPFVVEGLIAQGGMGNVYRAHQVIPVKRRAAVKVLRTGVSNRQLLERFEDERQAIARMEHRNIARLLDAGTADDGQAYIAMELVDGPPITEYAAIHNLSLEQRLGIFVQVCRGVQHAHNRGILHRDLKPSNILVSDEDAQPVPKIIDFGVAKLLAQDATRSGQTIAGQVLGTLGYISPEQTDQIRPDADVRSDVYALGTILYELLTGVLPLPAERLRGLSMSELHAFVSTHPRTPPSRVDLDASKGGVRHKLPPELDCLVLKACHPDPEQRYPSASELAADVDRYLAGHPIAAKPPSLAYLARKFVSRHRLPVISSAVILLALLAGILMAAIGLRQAILGQKAAEAALAQSQLEKARADQALARAEEVSAYLRQLLMMAHPSRLGSRATFDQILKSAATDFLNQPPADLIVRANVAAAIAEPLYLTGEYDLVERLLLPQIGTLADQDHPNAKSLRATIMLRLGYVASRQSRPQLASERFTAAAECARAADSAQVIYQTQGALAQTLSAAGKYDEAIDMLKRMLDSDVAKNDELLRASALSNLGVAYGRRGSAAEGLPYAREGYDIRLRRSPRDPTTHNMGWQLGISYMENAQLDESVRILEQTYQAARDAVGQDHSDVLAGVVLLNYARARRGDGPDVIPPMREAIARQRAVSIPTPQIVQSRMYLAGALLYAGLRDESFAETNDAISEVIAKTTPCDKAVVTVLLQIGTIYSAGGAAKESLNYLQRAFDCTQSNSDVAPFAQRIAGAITWSYRRLDDPSRAEQWSRTEAELRERVGQTK